MISIITPNYNGEKYLPECLDSIKNQTIDTNNFEMILIDDGSTDSSRDIVESYAKDIPHIKPIWHEHIGKPGELRNRAIKRAMGKYILFLDSDDFLGTEALERLEDFNNEYPSDLTVFELEGLNRDVMKFTETVPYADRFETGLYKSRGIWKMCTRSLIDRHNITFPEVKRGDDVIFFTDVLLNADTTSVIGGYPFYTVRGRDDGSSITQEKWPAHDRISLARKMAQLIVGNKKADDRTKDYLMLRAFNTDAVAILSDEETTDAEKKDLQHSLQPFWTNGVADLFYKPENLERVQELFGVPRSE